MIASRRGYLATLAAAALLLSASAVAKAPPDNWDGLVRVNAKGMDLLYLRPQADIRGYTRILLDAPEVAYDKNWRRNYDRSTTGHLARLSDRDIRAAIDDGKQMLTESFREAFQKAGYQVAPSPDSGVLRLSIYLLNVRRRRAGSPLGRGHAHFFERDGLGDSGGRGARFAERTIAG